MDYPRFIVDRMLGHIAKKLRIMGFDTEFWLAAGDDFLIDKSMNEQKLLVTRDVGLYLKLSKSGRNGLLLHNDDEVENLVFILKSCDIKHIDPVPNVIPDVQFATALLLSLIRQWQLISFQRKYTNVYPQFTNVQNVQKFIGMELM